MNSPNRTTVKLQQQCPGLIKARECAMQDIVTQVHLYWLAQACGL
jgi:hypothetical protein